MSEKQPASKGVGAAVSRMKRVADPKLEVGTLERPDLGFREQAAAMSESDQPVEATFRSRVVRESEDVEGGAATNIQVPHREQRGRAAGGKR